jgi:thiamine transport system substrate-binding protein
VLVQLEREQGIRLRVLRSGDAGVMVNQAILAGDAPLADVLFGIDNAFLSRALEAEIFEAYRSPLLDGVPAELQLDPEGRVTPIDYGDVCLNYDRAAFDEALPPPTGLDDLVDERYRGMLVVQNPATSSPGLAFLLATVIERGEGWRDYWRQLVDNDVLVTSGWSDAYYSHFSAAGDGERPIVVSYATSPVAEVVFADPPTDEAPTGVVTAACFRQVEFAAILAGTQLREPAERLIDFMLGQAFQEDVPLNMFVFPARADAQLPEVFVDHAADVEQPLTMDYREIGEQREGLIEEWTDVVLR